MLIVLANFLKPDIFAAVISYLVIYLFLTLLGPHLIVSSNLFLWITGKSIFIAKQSFWSTIIRLADPFLSK